MSRVSYQVALATIAPPPPAFRALDRDAIETRGKDARVTLTVDVSKRQARWLRSAAGSQASAITPDAVVRAAIDLAMELEIDWAAIDGAADLRAAIRDAVLVRRVTG
jgi:hypothetical protein